MDQRDNFYVHVNSHVVKKKDKEQFPNFKISLQEKLALEENQWEVALVSVSIPNGLKDVSQEQSSNTVFYTNTFLNMTRVPLNIQPGYYSPTEYSDHINASLKAKRTPNIPKIYIQLKLIYDIKRKRFRIKTKRPNKMIEYLTLSKPVWSLWGVEPPKEREEVNVYPNMYFSLPTSLNFNRNLILSCNFVVGNQIGNRQLSVLKIIKNIVSDKQMYDKEFTTLEYVPCLDIKIKNLEFYFYTQTFIYDEDNQLSGILLEQTVFPPDVRDHLQLSLHFKKVKTLT